MVQRRTSQRFCYHQATWQLIKRTTYDVLIAGAGPAGCAAAILLGQAGLHVALVDKVKEQQWKVGESLPGASIRLLRRLGISHLSTLLPSDAYSLCQANGSAWGSEQWSFRHAISNPEGGGWHLIRQSFDASLRSFAKSKGIDYFSNKLAKVEASTDNLSYLLYPKVIDEQTPKTFGAKWIIDATGRPSILSKNMGVDRQKLDNQMAAATWVMDKSNEQFTRIKSVAQGWWYTAALPTGYRVIAFHSRPSQIAELVKNPAQFFNQFQQSQLLKEAYQLTDALSPLVARDAGVSRLKKTSGHHWLAVGDAALAFDPLSSQGIFFALYSGIKAAEVILGSLQNPNHRSAILQDYEAKIDQVFAANKRARMHFYHSENRFPDQPYWQERHPLKMITSI